MRNITAIKRWVKAAEADGWKKSPATGPFSGKKPRGSTGVVWPKEYYILSKNGFEVMVWIGATAEASRLTFKFPDGTIREISDLNQRGGYNYQNLLNAQTQCPSCLQGSDLLIQFGLNKICQTCIDRIDEFSKEQLPETKKIPAGTFKIEFRHVHGKRSVNLVCGYRIIAKLTSDTADAYWEPYHGKSREAAYAISVALRQAMTCANFNVEYSEVHTDYNGFEIKTIR